MTGSEFQKWFDHFAAAFPAVKDFVRKGDPPSTPPERHGKATLTLWFEVLAKRDLADALAVTNGMFTGDLQAIPGTERGFPDWSQTPRHVSRLCAEMHPIVPEWKKHTERTGGKGIIQGDPSMAKAYKRCLEILEDYPPRSAEGKAAVSAFLDEFYGHKQSPAAARDKGNYEPAFDAFNQS